MVTTSGPWTVCTVFSLRSLELFSNTIWDKRAGEYVLKDEAWQTGGIFWLVFQQVNLTAQIKTTSSTTESGHTWQHTQTFHKKAHKCIYTQLCHSLKNLSASARVCACLCRGVLPAAQPLKGKRQTIRPIYSNTESYQDCLHNNNPAAVCKTRELKLNWLCCVFFVRVFVHAICIYIFVHPWKFSDFISRTVFYSLCKQDRPPEDIHPTLHEICSEEGIEIPFFCLSYVFCLFFLFFSLRSVLFLISCYCHRCWYSIYQQLYALAARLKYNQLRVTQDKSKLTQSTRH